MISGKSFADTCKWVIDPRYPSRARFNYSNAEDKDWVFVNGDYLHLLFYELSSRRDKRFTFIIHNSDHTFDQNKLQQLKPYSEHIYAINSSVYDPILTTIPIGFVDRQLPFLSTFKPLNIDRSYHIYMNFTTATNSQKRKECISVFKNHPRVVLKQNRSVTDYYEDLCKSKYVLCPEGTGIDTHRVYESILCGAIPVVLRNSLSHLYEKLPVCIIDNWTDPFYEPSCQIYEFNTEFYLKK